MEPYPKPDVPYVGHSDLYFATEAQVRSPFSVGSVERGELTMSPGRVTFRGMSVLVDCPDVTAVRLARKTFPWAMLLVLVVVVLGAALIAFQGSLPALLRRPITYVVTAIMLVSGLSYGRQRWVEVEYAGPDGPRRAYFRRERLLLGSASGRTRRLLDEIEARVLRGAGHCPRCNYDLTGNVSGVCPECGTRPA
jgi:hypothetical protein